MPPLTVTALVLGMLSVPGSANGSTQPVGLVAHWPFDGNLTDVSGPGCDAVGEAVKFADGHAGQAAVFDWKPVQVPHHPDLQVSPGLTLDCWVYFDRQPDTWNTIVYKEGEYQLRVDPPHEGGKFSFFVYLNGWEPRITNTVPEVRRWYHLVARWNGEELSLEVNGQRSSMRRTGSAIPGDHPIQIGAMAGRVDELRIFNPRLLAKRRLLALVESTPDQQRIAQAAFGGDDRWAGWVAECGAQMSAQEGALVGVLPNSAAMLVNPRLAVDVNRRPFVSLEITCPGARSGLLTFLTDKGFGEVPFPVWEGTRTTIVKAAHHPCWAGRLRLLGISFPDEQTHEARLQRLWVAERPAGRPFLWVRSVAPERAALRAGREEKVIAIVRNLGAAAPGVQARLVLPPGVKVVGEETCRIGELDHDGLGRAEWTVRADNPVTGTAKVIATADGSEPAEGELALHFTPPLNLPPASYVPPPHPAQTDYLILMHYCPLWKLGTHYGWDKIWDWPERRPAIGWYDEGTPEVADWHIKYALEHGIQGFIYCWYRADLEPRITHLLGHAIHDGLMKARYVNQFRFCIMWENGCAAGVKDRDDMMNNLLPYWMENYFKHPSYLKVDNRPVLFVWVPAKVHSDLGGPEATRGVFEEMRAACRREGFDGLYIIGCVSGVEKQLLRDMAVAGWDASSAYGLWGPAESPPGRDPEGIETISHAESLRGQKTTWLGKKAVGALPDIVDVMMGWDPRPWHGKGTQSYQAGVSAENFKAACLNAKEVVDSTPGNGLDTRMVVFDNWCEFGEGHYIEPVSGFGFALVDAIREVFCKGTTPCLDITPEDVGLEMPERDYRAFRDIMYHNAPKVRRAPADGLIAWWRFDDDHGLIALDASTCAFNGVKHQFASAEGISGKGFLCQGGSVSVGSHALLFPTSGITIELWYKTEVPNQEDNWMVNTVGAADTGYRLGLCGGKLTWQIPQTDWSHALACPNPAPLGRWTHVAATYDNETMRLYVDGEEQASMARGGVIHPSEASFCIGSYAPGHPHAFFEGLLDEVKLWNRALSAEEVRKAASPHTPPSADLP